MRKLITAAAYVVFGCLIGVGGVGCAASRPAQSVREASGHSLIVAAVHRDLPIRVSKTTPARSRTYMGVLIE